MPEIKDPDEDILNVLKKINKRLNSIHSWLAGFIIVTIIFYIIAFFLF